MGCESFDVFTFGLGPLLQGQIRTAKRNNAYNFRNLQPLCLLLLLLQVCYVRGYTAGDISLASDISLVYKNIFTKFTGNVYGFTYLCKILAIANC